MDKTEIEFDYKKTYDLFLAYGQEHVFRGWDRISPQQKLAFLQQLKNVDLDLVRSLSEEFILNGQQQKNVNGKFSLPNVIPIAKNEEQQKQAEVAFKLGEEFLQSGKVGLILVAGGQGTRLGFAGPKGKFTVTPVKKKSLFQLHAEKILALSKRYQTSLPWYIMTSESNDAETKVFFSENSYFGLNPSDVIFFQQNMIPAVNESGQLFLQSEDRIFTNPDGHGGTLGALKKSGALQDMAERGLEQLFYFQVDNVLAKIGDPLFVGYHAQADSDMSCKVVEKNSPEEKVGVVGYADGDLTVIEYSDLPKELMFAKNEDGSLVYGAGSIAIHMLKRAFIEKLTDGSLNLPFHLAHKKIAHLNESGEKIEPQKPNGYKFETFIFDALQYAANPVIMQVERKKEFSPVKNARGDNSLQTVVRDMNNLFGSWFEMAGIEVPRDSETNDVQFNLEISPLFAMDQTEFLEKYDAQIKLHDNLYLG